MLPRFSIFLFGKFLLSLFQIQPFEEFSLPLKVGSKRGEKEAFTKASRTAQEVHFPIEELRYVLCFIDVEVVTLSQILKALYADG